MQGTPHFIFHNNNSETIDLILHGKSKGIESDFINKLFQKSRNLGNSVLAFNFSYIDRGEEQTSGSQLQEEINDLLKVFKFIEPFQYKHVRLLGKSLGGIVAANFLSSYHKQYEYDFSLVILGFIAEEVTLDFADSIENTTIIQGSEDKFSSVKQINKYISKIGSHNVNVHIIVGANHSYKNPTTGEPEFEDEAIRTVFPDQ